MAVLSVIVTWLPLKGKCHIPPAGCRWKNMPVATAVSLASYSNPGSNTLLSLVTQTKLTNGDGTLYGQWYKFHQFLWLLSSPALLLLATFCSSPWLYCCSIFPCVLDRSWMGIRKLNEFHLSNFICSSYALTGNV